MSYELDEKGSAVVRALEDPTYNWRTVDGIAQETGIDAHQVGLFSVDQHASVTGSCWAGSVSLTKSRRRN